LNNQSSRAQSDIVAPNSKIVAREPISSIELILHKGNAGNAGNAENAGGAGSVRERRKRLGTPEGWAIPRTLSAVRLVKEEGWVF
jgi:hypothetical protein